jgi:hypothetical protein
MSQHIGKVSLGDLESFLRRRAEEWEVDDSNLHGFQEHLRSHGPVSLPELMLAFSLANHEDDHVFLYNTSELTPYQAANEMDLENIPSIGQSELDDFIVASVGSDFLYVAPSIDDVANAAFVNLIPADGKESTADDRSLEIETHPSIKRIIVQNFKGIGPSQVSIDLKPITLLYGPNSVGKSSILHSILYAREIFERRNLSPTTTAGGGNSIDLGGHTSFVHDHDRNDWITLSFEFDLGDALIPSYSLDRLRVSKNKETGLDTVPDFTADIKAAGIDVVVGWSEIRNECYVASYRVRINGEFLGSIRCEFGRREVELFELNVKHPLFRPGFAGPGAYCDSENDTLASYWLRMIRDDEDLEGSPIVITNQADALPRWGMLLELDLTRPGFFEEGSGMKDFSTEALAFTSAMTQLIVGPGEILRGLLCAFCYLGPLREPPARKFIPIRASERNRWANGLAAWDALYEADGDLVDRVSDWLGDSDRLDTGYRLQQRSIAELDLSSRLAAMLRSNSPLDEFEDLAQLVAELPVHKQLELVAKAGMSFQPHDVGIGISQVLPVVVLAMDQRVDFAAIEQPELHVHPSVQVGLGDLFIAKLYENPSTRLLIETHSEHLLLRLLRRIRQTKAEELQPGVFPSLNPDQVAVHYVTNKNGETQAVRLRVDDTGEFVDRWPEGFFEERAEELF